MEKLVGDYKKSKFLAEQEAILAARLGQDIVIVNPSSPIGTLDIKPTPTGDIILRFLRREMPFYLDTGLNFVDVRDVAWGHLLALAKRENRQSLYFRKSEFEFEGTPRATCSNYRFKST